MTPRCRVLRRCKEYDVGSRLPKMQLLSTAAVQLFVVVVRSMPPVCGYTFPLPADMGEQRPTAASQGLHSPYRQLCSETVQTPFSFLIVLGCLWDRLSEGRCFLVVAISSGISLRQPFGRVCLLYPRRVIMSAHGRIHLPPASRRLVLVLYLCWF